MDTGFAADRKHRHAFLNGYITGVVWANTYRYDAEQELEACEGSRTHLTRKAVVELARDAFSFYTDQYAYLSVAATHLRGGRKCTLEAAWNDLGYLFALSSAGHGAGFFDAGLGRLGDTLQGAARVYGGQDVVYTEHGVLEVL
jgi:hypothetical protein